jgi:hypothetical protein
MLRSKSYNENASIGESFVNEIDQLDEPDNLSNQDFSLFSNNNMIGFDD